MLIECRFCLEELEVEFPSNQLKKDDSNKFNGDGGSAYEQDDSNGAEMLSDCKKDDSCSSDSNDAMGGSANNVGGAYLELTPIYQSKRKRKDIGNRLVRPCACKGTQQHVHVKCLCEWIGKCNKWYCTICQRVYNLSPSQLHYCVVKLQRKGALKNLPPIYSHSDFSRSSYFALLVFMGTLSMLMLPSTIPQHTIRTTTTTTTTTTSASGYSSSYTISSTSYSSSGYFNSHPTTSAPLITIYPTLHSNWESSFPYYNTQLSTFFSSCRVVTHQPYPINYNNHILNQKFSSLVCEPAFSIPGFKSGAGEQYTTKQQIQQQSIPYMLRNFNRPYPKELFTEIVDSFCSIFPICSVGERSTTTI